MKRPTNERTLTPEGIASALAALGWKQSDLARRCGLTGKTVSRWCTGQAPAPLWLGEYLGALLMVRAMHQRFVSPSGLGAAGAGDDVPEGAPPAASDDEQDAG